MASAWYGAAYSGHSCFAILEIFISFTAPPWLARVPPPDCKRSDFLKLNLSDRTETLRIDAAGEVINVADYGPDPSTLSGFLVSKTCKVGGFVVLEVF